MGLDHSTLLSRTNRKIEVDRVEYGPACQNQIPVSSNLELVLRKERCVELQSIRKQFGLIVPLQSLNALRHLLE